MTCLWRKWGLIKNLLFCRHAFTIACVCVCCAGKGVVVGLLGRIRRRFLAGIISLFGLGSCASTGSLPIRGDDTTHGTVIFDGRGVPWQANLTRGQSYVAWRLYDPATNTFIPEKDPAGGYMKVSGKSPKAAFGAFADQKKKLEAAGFTVSRWPAGAYALESQTSSFNTGFVNTDWGGYPLTSTTRMIFDAGTPAFTLRPGEVLFIGTVTARRGPDEEGSTATVQQSAERLDQFASLVGDVPQAARLKMASIVQLQINCGRTDRQKFWDQFNGYLATAPYCP